VRSAHNFWRGFPVACDQMGGFHRANLAASSRNAFSTWGATENAWRHRVETAPEPVPISCVCAGQNARRVRCFLSLQGASIRYGPRVTQDRIRVRQSGGRHIPTGRRSGDVKSGVLCNKRDGYSNRISRDIVAVIVLPMGPPVISRGRYTSRAMLQVRPMMYRRDLDPAPPVQVIAIVWTIALSLFPPDSGNRSIVCETTYSLEVRDSTARCLICPERDFRERISRG